MEVIRMKTHSAATCQPRFHARTRTGVPLEKPQNSDVTHQVNHSKRCKGDARERIIGCHFAPQAETHFTSENWRTLAPSLWKIRGVWEIPALQKKKSNEVSVTLTENVNFSKENGLLVNNVELHSFVTRGVLQAFKDHLYNDLSKLRVTNLTWFVMHVLFSEIIPSQCHVVRLRSAVASTDLPERNVHLMSYSCPGLRPVAPCSPAHVRYSSSTNQSSGFSQNIRAMSNVCEKPCTQRNSN